MGWFGLFCVTTVFIPAVFGFLLSEDPLHNVECAPRGTIVVSNKLPHGTQLPSLPKLGFKFQTILEGNLGDINITKTSREYFDAYRSLAAVHIIGNSTTPETRYILDYRNDQLVTVQFNSDPVKHLPTCEVSDLGSSYIRTFFESKASKQYNPTITSSTEALHLAKSNGLMYLGKQTVDGITTDHWQSCINYEDASRNYTMDLYFTDESWSTTYGHKQVPIMFQINSVTFGLFKTNSTYVYSNFKVLGKDDEFDNQDPFQVPENVICPGYKAAKTQIMPSLPDSYAYRFDEEMIGQKRGNNPVLTQTTKVWYDKTRALARYDTHARSQAPYFTNNSITEISDFSKGLSYCIDNVLGNCTVTPLIKSAAVTEGKKMKSVNEFFQINSTHQYIGKKTTRDLASDVFVAMDTTLVVGSNDSSQVNPHSVVTHYFSAAQLQNSLTQQVPVRIVINYNDSVYHGDWAFIYNIFNFQSYKPVYQDAFDITRCFADHQKVPLKIVFKGVDKQKLQPNRVDVLTNIVEYVARVTSISYIRVQKADLYFQGNDAVFSCTIVDSHQSYENGKGSDTIDRPTMDAVDTLQQMVTSRTFQVLTAPKNMVTMKK